MKIEIAPKAPIIIVIGGIEYPVTRPKLGAALDVEAAITNAQAQGKGGVSIVVEHLVRCGLPLHVVRDLDGDDVEAIMGALTPAKKKS